MNDFGRRNIDAFFENVAARIESSATVYVFGASDLVLWDPDGAQAAGIVTREIDFGFDPPESDAVFNAIQDAAGASSDIHIDEGDHRWFIQLPGAENRHRKYGEYGGKLTVYLVDLYTLAAGKLERNERADQKAVDHMLRSGLVDRVVLADLIRNSNATEPQKALMLANLDKRG